MSPHTDIQEILVLEPDRLRGAVLARTISGAFPLARVYCESEPAVAAVVMAQRSIDLFVVALRGFDLDILTLLGVWAEHDAERTRVLVVTPDVNSTAFTAMRNLPITGVFDSSSGDLHEFEVACRTIASGACYWSSTVPAVMKAGSAPVPESYLGGPSTDYVDTPLSVSAPAPRHGRSTPPPRPRRFRR